MSLTARTLTLLFIVPFVWVASSQGQINVPEGEATVLRGIVTDGSGAAIKAPGITLLNVENQWSKTIKGDNEGRFTFPTLAAGKYKITAAAEGYATGSKNLSLKKGQKATVSLKLKKSTK